MAHNYKKVCPRCKHRKINPRAYLCPVCKEKIRPRCKVCKTKLNKSNPPYGKSKTGYCRPCYRKYLAGDQLPHGSEFAKYARSFGRQKKLVKPRFCKDCGKQIKSRTAKFCKSCVCKYRPNRFDDPKEREAHSELLRASPNVHRGKKHHWFRHGHGSLVGYAPGWNGKVQKRIKERDGYKCVLCSSKKLLRVHHIDFGKDNHSKENLVTVCMSCHSKIHAKFDPRYRGFKRSSQLPRIKPVKSVKTFIRQYRAKLAVKTA